MDVAAVPVAQAVGSSRSSSNAPRASAEARASSAGPGRRPRRRGRPGTGRARPAPPSRPRRRRRTGRRRRPRAATGPPTWKPGAFGSPSTRNGSYALPSHPAFCPGARPPGAAGWATVQGIVTAEGSAHRRRRGSSRLTRAPRCGESFAEGPAASEKGVGARWPVKVRWARRKVRGVVVRHRPDDRQPVRPRRQQREMLADADARDAGRDRLELPADLDRARRASDPTCRAGSARPT